MAVDEDLAGGHDRRQVEAQRGMGGGKGDGKPVPCESAHARVALLGPWLVTAQERPGGVIECGIRPSGIVAGMKAPIAVERDKRLAVALKIEGCFGLSEFRTGRRDEVLAGCGRNFKAGDDQQAEKPCWKPVAEFWRRRHQSGLRSES